MIARVIGVGLLLAASSAVAEEQTITVKNNDKAVATFSDRRTGR